MPLYEYKCGKCGHLFEKIESHSASPTKKCPQCGGKAERQLAPSAIQFKGTGWYVTDYARKGSAAASGERSGNDASPKPEQKPAETKPHAEKPTTKKKR